MTNSIEDRPASALNYAKLFVAHGLKISHAPDFGGWPAPDLDAFVVIYCYIVSLMAKAKASVVALQTSKSKPHRRELLANIGGLIYGCLPIETLLRCSTQKPCSVEAALAPRGTTECARRFHDLQGRRESGIERNENYVNYISLFRMTRDSQISI